MKRYIYDTVCKLKSEYMSNDPFEIAECVGTFVSYANIGSLKGLYTALYGERHIILSNSLDERECIMVCAHELGHDRLHGEYRNIVGLKDAFVLQRKNMLEYEANIFTADLLIDDDQITELQGDYDFGGICGLLGVDANLLVFKLLSMNGRGYCYDIPRYDSKFLAK